MMFFQKSHLLLYLGRSLAGELALRSCLSNVKLMARPEEIATRSDELFTFESKAELEAKLFPPPKIEFGVKPPQTNNVPFWRQGRQNIHDLRKPRLKILPNGPRLVNRGWNE